MYDLSGVKLRGFAMLLTLVVFSCAPRRDETKILLFSDNSLPALEEQLLEVAAQAGWSVEKTADPKAITEDFLRPFSSIVTTCGAISTLDHRGVTVLKRYLEAGGGGIAAIKDTLHTQREWPWLRAWNEWPAGSRHQQDQARVVMLAPGAGAPELRDAIAYTIDDNKLPDYRKAATLAVPDPSRYTLRVLTQGMDEPMQMALLPGNNVLMVERKGAVKFYNDSTKQTHTIAQFNVFSGIEDGLLGVAIDPAYAENHYVYFYYAAAGPSHLNRLSRFEFRGGTLDMASEKVMLEIPTQRIYCCHSAGYLAFDAQGLLYLSTGDNTNAEETDGYVPIDERPGRELSDDQATAANSNDLRGKILRIKPEPDGTYSVPDGNLFPKDGSEGRPEIYVMGCRNPYRFSIDAKTNFLYWGDVGPDTKVQASEGTLSFDEINQARGPGFFGWPYFLGNNEPMPDYDFATKKEGPPFNALEPVNNSPNNTGIRTLPPAQPAMIWYGDNASSRFPLLGKGGESAMAGPVYYTDLFPEAPYKLPAYYDGKLFIYDWVRRWFMAVTLDGQGHYLRMEPFLDHLTFIAPTDMQIASDGAVYILEYGTNWFAKNSDARLIRIEYTEGNRRPLANITTDALYGQVPFSTTFSAESSLDFDEKDELTYTWEIAGKKAEGPKISHTFATAGAHEVTLTVKDNHGAESRSAVTVKAGNAPPQVSVTTRANRTFYWDRAPFDYEVTVTDPEDQPVDVERVAVSLNFLPQGKDLAVILADPRAAGNVRFARGKRLLADLDCKACHTLAEPSVGPPYRQIADRYAKNPGIETLLASKIIEGGAGNWGDRPMSSHPDLSMQDATEIVRYILSLNDADRSLPLKGSVVLKEHLGQGYDGSYLFLAHYTDKGAHGIEPLYSSAHVALRNPRVQIEDSDDGDVRLGTITTVFMTFATGIRHESFVRFNNFDLTHVRRLTYRVQSHGIGGNIEVRLGGKDGRLISTLSVPAGKEADPKAGWKEVSARLTENVAGIHDVFFVFTTPQNARGNLFNVDWIHFGNL